MPSRLRHHTSPNVYLPANELKIMPDYYPPLIEMLDWKEVFANGKKPDCLDIGCGKGGFLLQFAIENPQKNILGIEVRKPVVEWLKKVIVGEKIENCAVLWYSAANKLPFIEDNSVENVFYLYPDPWFKAKHKKRRLFSDNFTREVNRLLKNGGKLYLATDVEEVHQYQIEIIENIGLFKIVYLKENIILSEQEPDVFWQIPITNKEKFCLSKQIPVYRIILEK